MNKQVNFTTVMDYRQTFTVDIDFEEIKKDLMANADFDDEEVQGTWDDDDLMYQYAWDLVMENPDKYRDHEWCDGDFDNEVVYHDCIL